MADDDVVLCEICGKHKATVIAVLPKRHMYDRKDIEIALWVCGYCNRWKPNTIWAELTRRGQDAALARRAA